MIKITSAENNLIKKISKLQEKKYRGEFNEYFAEGSRWVGDCIKTGRREAVSALVVKESCEKAFADTVRMFDDKCYVVSDSLFARISGAESDQGIMAVLKIPEEKKDLTCDFCLLLDRIRDPGNMGTIIRSACATGFRQIICRNCVDAYNPKSIRSSMTGILHVEFVKDREIGEIKATHSLVCADMSGKNVFEIESKRKEKICLVVGNEANGIDREILSAADLCVSLPMEDIDSLNAAVSATTLMYLMRNL